MKSQRYMMFIQFSSTSTRGGNRIDTERERIKERVSEGYRKRIYYYTGKFFFLNFVTLIHS